MADNLAGEDIEFLRHEHLGRWLSLSNRFYEESVIRGLNEAGFSDIRIVHASLIRCMDRDGTRLTDIAERAGMYKQAIGQLVRECEEAGYIVRRNDPHDGRAQLVHFTARGLDLLQSLGKIHAACEETFRALVGTRQMEGFKKALQKVAEVQKQREKPRLAGQVPAVPKGQ